MTTFSSPDEAVRKCGRRVYVAVDIGGTNTRVCIATHEKDMREGVLQEVVVKRKTNVMQEMLALLREFESSLIRMGVVVLGAAVAGPGPRAADGETLGPFSNFTAECRLLTKSMLPPGMFPSYITVLLNDLEAAAYGITSISKGGTFNQHFTHMWGPRDAAKMHLENGPYLVLAVGTGCGTGLVHGAKDNIQVLPVEFGHTTVCPMEGDREFLDFLGEKLYGKGQLPEYEDIVGGRGLVSCYDWELGKVGRGGEVKEPAEVAKKAAGGCEMAKRALFTHYKYLIRLASDLSMGFVLGGVVIAGDNIMHNEAFVADAAVTEALKKAFLSHTMERFGFQSRSDVIRQTKSLSLNLEGAFYKAKEVSLQASARM